MKRIISIILFCAMILSFAACASDSDKKTADTTAAQTTSTQSNVITNEVEPMSEALRELDYGGEKIVILQRNPPSDPSTMGSNSQFTDELFAQELTNDPINDAIYNRNLAVSEILGVELLQETADAYTELQQKVMVMVNAGDTTYDIVAGNVAWSTPMILRGEVFNLYDNGIDTYLDTTKPWWPQYWIEEAEISEKLYCITGGPALSLSRLMVVWFYNKTMGEAHGIEDLYKVVDEGRWTMDYVSSMVSSIYRDLNGNDMRDMEDEYGIAIDNYDNADIFWSGFDLEYISKNSDGMLELNTSVNEKIYNAYDMIYSLTYDNVGSFYYRHPSFSDNYSNNYERQSVMFANGSVLLAPLHLQFAETPGFRNMQDVYGILPTPKYDEHQEDYYTYVHDQCSIFLIPTTVKDPEMSGAVLEAMAYESYKTLTPAYFEVALKGRYANDPESRKILDMIANNVIVDTGVLYGAFFGYPAADIIRSNMGRGNTSCVSTVEGYARKIPKVIKSVVSEIEKLDY